MRGPGDCVTIDGGRRRTSGRSKRRRVPGRKRKEGREEKEKRRRKKKKNPDHAGPSASRILIIDRGGEVFFFVFARFKSQPTLISRALRRDKFTRRTCYHSRGTPHAFILDGGEERVRRGGAGEAAGSEGRREAGGRTVSMKGAGDFSISHSSRRYKCRRTARVRMIPSLVASSRASRDRANARTDKTARKHTPSRPA